MNDEDLATLSRALQWGHTIIHEGHGYEVDSEAYMDVLRKTIRVGRSLVEDELRVTGFLSVQAQWYCLMVCNIIEGDTAPKDAMASVTDAAVILAMRRKPSPN